MLSFNNFSDSWKDLIDRSFVEKFIFPVFDGVPSFDTYKAYDRRLLHQKFNMG